jgi:hypothetical protein
VTRSWICLLSALSLVACGGLSEGDYIGEFGAAYCQKVQGCYPNVFQSAYPSGQPDCLATFSRGLTSKALGQKTACSTAQVNGCLSDVAGLKCGQSLADMKLPASCTCQ